MNKKNIVDDKEDNDGSWEEFVSCLDIIFNEENSKYQEIKEKDIKKVTKIILKLRKKENLLIEKFSEYFKIKFNQREVDKYSMNLLYKKNKIFEILNKSEDSIINLKEKREEKEKEKAGFLGYFWGGKDNNKEKKVEHKKDDNKKVDVKKFDINGFRKEFNLPEDEFPDKLLKEKYIECKGNQKLMFYKLSGIVQ